MILTYKLAVPILSKAEEMANYLNNKENGIGVINATFERTNLRKVVLHIEINDNEPADIIFALGALVAVLESN